MTGYDVDDYSTAELQAMADEEEAQGVDVGLPDGVVWWVFDDSFPALRPHAQRYGATQAQLHMESGPFMLLVPAG